jgi:predicted Zn-dependent protease
MGGSGALAEAEAALEQGLQVEPNSAWIMAVLAGVYARQGKSDQAVWIRTLVEALDKQQYVASIVLGLVEAAAGNLDQGFQLIEQAVNEHQFWSIFLIRSPLFQELLAGPRYDALLRKMNLL